jgi:hypothetical protein
MHTKVLPKHSLELLDDLQPEGMQSLFYSPGSRTSSLKTYSLAWPGVPG